MIHEKTATERAHDRAFRDGLFARDLRLCKDLANPEGGFPLWYWLERIRGSRAMANLVKEATRTEET